MHQPSRLSSLLSISLCALAIALTSCSGGGGQEELGEAYVAPATLNLRREIAQKTANVAILKHGERVAVIDVKRRFVKIRTSKHQEGWVDSLQLLSTEQMDQVRREAKAAATLPSEGSASVFEALNVHIEPNRQSPGFTRIEEGQYVSVLAQHLSPKITEAPRAPVLVKERPLPEHRRNRRGKATRANNLPPPPAPPKAPENWQELSAERSENGDSPALAKKRREQETAALQAAEALKPVQYETWTLVRLKDKESGWVLARNLVMAIPDEVAQYAEGKRITSYFDLGVVKDEEKGTKHNWLWTTASKQMTYDFDAWRVFLWNRRRHRYETSFRQRDVEGHFPVVIDPAEEGTFGRTFHLITRDEDGKFRSRGYNFDSVRVHLSATEDYSSSGSPLATAAKALDTGKMESKKSSLLNRTWQSVRSHLPGAVKPAK